MKNKWYNISIIILLSVFVTLLTTVVVKSGQKKEKENNSTTITQLEELKEVAKLEPWQEAHNRAEEGKKFLVPVRPTEHISYYQLVWDCKNNSAPTDKVWDTIRESRKFMVVIDIVEPITEKENNFRMYRMVFNKMTNQLFIVIMGMLDGRCGLVSSQTFEPEKYDEFKGVRPKFAEQIMHDGELPPQATAPFFEPILRDDFCSY